MRDHEHLPATHRSNALLLTCTLAALTATAPAAPTITAVPIIQNESTVLATALSYDGSTVAGFSYNSTTSFTWSGAGAPTILYLPSNWSYDVPRAMNADGTALTGYAALGNPLSVQASRWTQAGGWQSLGSLGGTEAYGNAISADGLVVAGDGLLPSTTTSLAYRWTPGGGLVTLPLGAGNTSAYATAMNQAGTVIVGATDPGPRAMRWTQIAGTENIGAVAGDTNSYAYAVSADGSRISGTSGTTSCPRGFYWVEGQGMTPIGPFAGFSRVSADRMTPDGGAVCLNMNYQCGTSTIFDRAAIWTQSRGMVELHQYLAEQGLNTGGWTLNTIVGVSNDGTVIAGNGNLGGWGRGYVIRGLNPICGPWIASQPPANVTACSTGVTGINVDAYSPFVPGHVTFQWHRQYIQGDGEANRIPLTNGFTSAGGFIDGATTPYLQLYGLQPGDAGQYVCLVTAGCGSV